MFLGVPRGFPGKTLACSRRSRSYGFVDNALMKSIPSIVFVCASRNGWNVRRAACFVAVALALNATNAASA